MPKARAIGRLLAAAALATLTIATTTGVAPPDSRLIVNGDFEKLTSGDDLRKDSKGQDWYESRKDGEGRKLLKLSTKNVGGNGTKKAMIKASPELNTYLSQRFAKPQKGRFNVAYDIFIREIRPEYDRSAFMFIGGIVDKKGGPNSTARERFVYLGFENSEAEGKVNLFVREGSTKWSEKTYVVMELDLDTWYTVKLAVDVPNAVYQVSVDGVSDAYEVEAYFYKGKTLSELTHISFASWNDGAGTFYIDNIKAEKL
jgi:hypothetical protein